MSGPKVIDLGKRREDAKFPPTRVLENLQKAIADGKIEPRHLIVIGVQDCSDEGMEGYIVSASDEITTAEILHLLTKICQLIVVEQPVMGDRNG